MLDQELSVIEDSDMDSLFILPLSIIPLQTPELRIELLPVPWTSG